MTARSIDVVGGGVAGLYLARLLALSGSGRRRVRVFERNEPGATAGFGIVVTGATQQNLADADLESFEAIRRIGWTLSAQSFRIGQQSVSLHHVGPQLALDRGRLLQLLAAAAEAAGAELHFGCRRSLDDLDGDVVVGADGMHSEVRTKLQDRFQPEVDTGQTLYLWAGADVALHEPVFAPVTTEHGTFVTHAYPYAQDRSTFLVETDEATWRRAGFDRQGADIAPAGSDLRSLEYLSAAFSDVLGGHRLLGNRSRWSRFRTVECQRWSTDRVVLAGDAAHTAHYSLGSGAKLAMEDAICLATNLEAHDGLAAAFAAYESNRRPAVQRLQHLALRSQHWWDTFPARVDLPLPQLAFSFMTRAGNVSLTKLSRSNPQVAAAALCSYAGHLPADWPPLDLATWVLEQPSRAAGPSHPSDWFWVEADDVGEATLGSSRPAGVLVTVEPTAGLDTEIERVCSSARRAVEAGVTAVRLRGGTTRHALLDRFAVGEAVRLQIGVPVVVDAVPGLEADLADGLVSGRADLLAHPQREPT